MRLLKLSCWGAMALRPALPAAMVYVQQMPELPGSAAAQIGAEPKQWAPVVVGAERLPSAVKISV